MPFSSWTLSSVTNSVLTNLCIIAAFVKPLYLQRGHYVNNSAMAIAGFVAAPPLIGLYEKFNRRAYVERQLGDALTAQQTAAKHAQRATLESVV
eukprot:CAMPEP_0174877374 /NCGR_PEP_ID=MMETSP1114-20130205/81761_1 /TAXON_ID=312471 /ORGANISM="Neobodo designis, Strain CCAP 1951/1" /LENGTH=93 /DNA_ID=CAMNT_0016112753 /DNA_START=13 /DNA_END=290 /DNA_ORIENTATION=+